MTIGEFGMLLALIGQIPYMWLIVRGTVRPSRSSWFIWALILALAILGYRSSGADDSIWFLVGDFIATFSIFLLSLWRGVGGWNRIDTTCLTLAGLSLLLWQASSVPLFALWGALIADAIALVPTVIKSLRDPASESSSAYVFSGLAALCGILAVAQWNLTLLFYPAYLFLANMFIAVVVWVGQYQVRNHNLKKAEGSAK
jgi:hypothetical protein